MWISSSRRLVYHQRTALHIITSRTCISSSCKLVYSYSLTITTKQKEKSPDDAGDFFTCNTLTKQSLGDEFLKENPRSSTDRRSYLRRREKTRILIGKSKPNQREIVLPTLYSSSILSRLSTASSNILAAVSSPNSAIIASRSILPL